MEAVQKCRIISDYEKRSSNELSLKTGDIVDVIRRGTYTWYGKFDEQKGFFPSKIAEMIEETSPEINDEVSSPESAPDDVEDKTVPIIITDETVNTEIEEEDCDCAHFNEIAPTTPLEDKRRNRARSSGRPPSQLFIKENILRYNSQEDLCAALEDEVMEENEEKLQTQETKITTKITSISQAAYEMKPTLKTVALQKEIATTITGGGGGGSGDTPPDNKPEWMKALKKKAPAPAPPAKVETVVDNTPPWMKEIRKRKEHKISLKGDEPVPKLGTESETLQDKSNVVIKETKIEARSATETHTRVVNEEKGSVTKSFSTTSTSSNFSIGSFKSTNDDVSTPEVFKDFADLIKFNQTPTEDKNPSISEATGNKFSKSVESLDTLLELKNTPNKEDAHNERQNLFKKYSSSTETLNSPKDISVEETPKISITESKKVEETITEVPAVKEEHETKVNEETPSDSCEKKIDAHKEKVSTSIQLLMKKFEKYETTAAARTHTIREQIQTLETETEQQHEEMKKFISSVKGELSELIKTSGS